jgi:hypothetical protein
MFTLTKSPACSLAKQLNPVVDCSEANAAIHNSFRRWNRRCATAQSTAVLAELAKYTRIELSRLKNWSLANWSIGDFPSDLKVSS